VIRATKESDLRKAYSLIESNGREQGYSTRLWEEFGSTLSEQVKKGQAIVFVGCREGQFLGVHYGVLAGQRYSYLMGGTVRTQENYHVGAFLHWQAMKTAYAMGLRGYDLTTWGSPGVAQFKQGFRPTEIKFASPHYFVLSRLRFSVFMKLYPALKKYRSTLARYANMLNRNP
jgi:lipid II:glycine glycyltransferase (peptidoglycan interpeptide bridge formation enzyme)